EIADRARKILREQFPGTETLQAPGGLCASVFANGYLSPLVVEVRGEKLEALNEEARAVAEVARHIDGVRDVRLSMQLDYPEVRVNVDRAVAGMVGTDAREVGQTTLDATLGNINTPAVWIDANNGQSYYVVTSYHGVNDVRALGELPVRVSGEG